MTEDGAKLIIERRSQLPSPFTARDVQRKGWAGLADRDLVQMAIETVDFALTARAVSAQSGSFGRPRSEKILLGPEHCRRSAVHRNFSKTPVRP